MTESSDARPEREPALDFYISYTGQGSDRLWAEWIGGQLKRAGYTVELDVWSWLPGENIILAREGALRRAERVIAVCSDAYFSGGYTEQDWTAVLAAKHREKGRLIPVWIEDLDAERLPSLLRTAQPIRLAGTVEDEASALLLNGLKGELGPGDAPPFPGPVGPARPGKPGQRGRANPRGNGASAGRGEKPGDRFPGTSQPAVRRIPPRNRDFTGRDAVLVRIREALLTGSPGVVVLQGPGGVGKTQLSTEYAHRFASDYDTIWVIDAEQAGLITSQLAELALDMGVVKGAADAQVARVAVAALRERGRWLLVLDNVEDPDEIREFLPDGPGHALITARAGNWDEIATIIEVEEFSRAESTALLTSRVRGLSTQDAADIAEALGDLPLALAQATGTLQMSVSPAEFRRLLATQASRVLARGKPPSYGTSLAAATLIACDKLADADPRAASLLRLCAYLAPEIIPAAWFYELPKVAALAPEAAEALPDGPLEVADAFDAIKDRGLGRVDQRGLKVHRLTQAVIRDHMSDRRDAYLVLIAGMLAAVAPEDTEDAVHWPRWSQLVPHLLTVPIESAPGAFRPLACAAAGYLNACGQSKAAVALAEQLHMTWTAELGPDNPDTLAAAEQLGWALYETEANARSLEITEDTLQRRRRVLGADDPATLTSGNNLSIVLNEIGQYRESLALCEGIYERRRQVLGEEHRDTMRSASTVAISLFELGRQEDALAIERDMYKRRCRILGHDHPDTITSAAILGEKVRELGRLAEALALAQDVYERRRRVLGEDHPHSVRAAANLAIALTAQGRRKEALRLARDVHERFLALSGEDHPDTLRNVIILARLLADDKRWPEAFPLLLDYLARHRTVLGDDDDQTLNIQSIYGQVIFALGRRKDALTVNQDVYERRVKTLGEEHPNTVQAAEILASNLEALGRKAEAIRLRRGKPKGHQGDNSKRRPSA
jgi:hypothetical protein